MSDKPLGTKERRARAARRRLADAGTYAAMDAAHQAGKNRYDRQIEAVVDEMKTLLAGRLPGDLTGADTVTFMSIKARFYALVTEQKHFIEADLASRLDPDDDGSASPPPSGPSGSGGRATVTR